MIRAIRVLALTGVLLMVLTACGGEAGNSTTPTLPTLNEKAADDQESAAATPTTEAVDPEEAFQKYTACMSEHGIAMPDATEGGVIAVEGDGSTDFEAFEAASTECDPILDAAFGEFEMSPEEEAEMMDQELAFAQCMRDNGIDWPDPTTNGGGVIELGDDVDPDTVDAAIETCSTEAFGDLGGVIVGGESK